MCRRKPCANRRAEPCLNPFIHLWGGCRWAGCLQNTCDQCATLLLVATSFRHCRLRARLQRPQEHHWDCAAPDYPVQAAPAHALQT